MASQDNLTILQHKATGEVYYTRKNRKKLANTKLKLKKYSPKLNKHVVFEEVKKAGAKKPAKQEGGKKKGKKSEEQ